ncbi:MAG: zinc-binding dehydrogenase [Actinomycetaceae bacterium]|nr:zinc-binding dehydrogenase [Actinomycetaceae bacterium]
MRAAFLNRAFDITVTGVPKPVIQAPTDAIIRVVASCVCGSDLWRYRGITPIAEPQMMGHEAVGVIVELGADVTGFSLGDFVVNPFMHSCGVCPDCVSGFTGSCRNGGSFYSCCQAEFLRVPQAGFSMVKVPGFSEGAQSSKLPEGDLLKSLLSLSDVMGTGWHAAVSAGVREGSRVAVVGDGAVGLCGVLAAKTLGAHQIIAMSRNPQRQALAREFGATDIVEARGDEGVAVVMDLTDGIGADGVLECVGDGPGMLQAIKSCRPGGTVGWVGVPHDIEIPMRHIFEWNVGLKGGMAPVRAYLPSLLEQVMSGTINPGSVFTKTRPLEEAAEAYDDMDKRREIKVMLSE